MIDDFKLIQETGKEMATQDNRGTQYVLFAIQVDVSRYVNEHADWEFKERNEYYDDGYCNGCDTVLDEGGDLPEDCDDCPSEAFLYFNVEQEFDLNPGVFFTAKACEDHIKENHYHYRNPKSYGIGAWRNPEMQAVMRQIIKAGDQEVPSHYA